MTREQAIRILIGRYNSSVIRSRTNDDEWRLATDTAIAALRGPQPDPDTGCPECSWIDPALSDCNYCKNCGRRLRDALIERTEVER